MSTSYDKNIIITNHGENSKDESAAGLDESNDKFLPLLNDLLVAGVVVVVVVDDAAAFPFFFRSPAF